MSHFRDILDLNPLNAFQAGVNAGDLWYSIPYLGSQGPKKNHVSCHQGYIFFLRGRLSYKILNTDRI